MSNESQADDAPLVSETLRSDPDVFREVKALFTGATSVDELEAAGEVIDRYALESVFGDDLLAGDKLDVMTVPLDRELAALITQSTFADRDELEAIVEITGRPSLLVTNDNWADPLIAEVKKRLDDAREKLQPRLKSVGRIEIVKRSNTNRPKMIGTGWMIDDDIMVTNSHVASEFAKADEAQDKFSFTTEDDFLVQADLKREHEIAEKKIIRVKNVLWIDRKKAPPNQKHFEFDMAFLRVCKTDFDLPEPLELLDKAAELHQKVVAIGFPKKDPRNDSFVMNEYFRGIYEVKRLSPGQLIGVDDVGGDGRRIEHDCTTLGGSSGSALIDLETGKVVGLHFAGKYKKRNLALKISYVKEKLAELT